MRNCGRRKNKRITTGLRNRNRQNLRRNNIIGRRERRCLKRKNVLMKNNIAGNKD
jgi:hypothetical protein